MCRGAQAGQRRWRARGHELIKAPESRALRMYEDLGLLCPAGRTSSGYRRYDQKSIDQVRYIEQLQLMGLSLTEIQKWVQDFRTKVEKESSGRDIMFILRELYAQKQIELQQKITDLQRINEFHLGSY